MRLILPKTHPDTRQLENLDRPLFFLAGPILGADDWQHQMALLLDAAMPGCIIVNPSPYTLDHPLYASRLDGSEIRFPNRTLWERYYLEQAGIIWVRGCIIFWLANESGTNPRIDGKPYAMDTRGELGEWRARAMGDKNVRQVIGADPTFPGLLNITMNTRYALGENFPFYVTMEETVAAAVAIAMD